MSYCNSSTVWHSITWRQLPPGYCPPVPPESHVGYQVIWWTRTSLYKRVFVRLNHVTERPWGSNTRDKETSDTGVGNDAALPPWGPETRDRRCCCRGWRLTRGPGLSSSWYTTTDALFIEGRLTCGPCQGRLRVESLFTCDSDFLSQWQQYSS